MAILKFLGRGAGFSDDHTSAYFFTDNKEMVLIDCPVSAFMKLKHFDFSDCERINILITHTHGDHIGGLGLFIQYAYFTLKKPVTVIAPSWNVKDDILILLEIEGNEETWYQLIEVNDVQKAWLGEFKICKPWLIGSIPTTHSPQLKGKCFGYYLLIGKQSIIYTGDTSSLEEFVPYLRKGSELYVDTSVHYGMIHLKLEEILEDLISLTKKGVKVYLMHLDDVEAAEKIVSDIPNIEVVTVE